MKRIVYKIYLVVCAMTLLTATHSYAQTIDYSGYDASYEIIGSDTAMIKVTVEGVSFNFIKVEGGKMNLGQLGFCQIGTFWLMETEVTNEIASLFFESYLDLRQNDFPNYPPIFDWSSVPSYSSDIIMQSPFIILDDYSYGPSYQYAQKVYDEYIYVIPNALCELLNGFEFFIPSTKQWTFAARGGNMSMHYTYSGSNNQDEVAWHAGNSYVETLQGRAFFPHPVKCKMPNELGLYDMSGNVFEFVNDEAIVGIKEWSESSSHAISELQDAKSKVICGGDFATDDCYAAIIPKSQRYDGSIGDPRTTCTGIRLALVPNNK